MVRGSPVLADRRSLLGSWGSFADARVLVGILRGRSCARGDLSRTLVCSWGDPARTILCPTQGLFGRTRGPAAGLVSILRGLLLALPVPRVRPSAFEFADAWCRLAGGRLCMRLCALCIVPWGSAGTLVHGLAHRREVAGFECLLVPVLPGEWDSMRSWWQRCMGRVAIRQTRKSACRVCPLD